MDPVYNRFFNTADQATRTKAIQEWLSLNGHGVTIDGVLGPATRQALKDFQAAHQLNASGEADDETLNHLVDPMRTALRPIAANGATLSELVIAYAKQHLVVHPREAGGQNMGPWVRLYMYGNQGAQWPWCAGFASFVLRQACESLNIEVPFATSPSCALMAESAQKRKMYLPGAEVARHKREELNGAVFFVRQPGRWVHTGIVISAAADYFATIEGNTNDEGSPEGYEVCRRTRGYENKDFILLG